MENTGATSCEPQVSVTVIWNFSDQSTQPVITVPPHCFHSALIWEPCQKSQPTRDKKWEGKYSDARGMRWGGSKKERGRRTESRWMEGRSEIRVLVFYSQDDCWEVKREADVAVWSDSSWKAQAAAVATCWPLIENGSLPLRNRFPLFSPKRAQTCWVMFLGW